MNPGVAGHPAIPMWEGPFTNATPGVVHSSAPSVSRIRRHGSIFKYQRMNVSAARFNEGQLM